MYLKPEGWLGKLNTKPLISVETPSFKAELKRLEQAVKDAEVRSRKSEAQIQQEIQAWLPFP